MDPCHRNDLVLLLQQHQNQVVQVHQLLIDRRRRRRWRRVVRNIWVRDWIGRRPELGLYDRLMVELHNEDPRAFQNFMRMPPAMFNEIVQRTLGFLLARCFFFLAGELDVGVFFGAIA
jgi:hypothetical protein